MEMCWIQKGRLQHALYMCLRELKAQLPSVKLFSSPSDVLPRKLSTTEYFLWTNYPLNPYRACTRIYTSAFCSVGNFVIFFQNFLHRLLFLNLLHFYSSMNQSQMYKGKQDNYLKIIK